MKKIQFLLVLIVSFIFMSWFSEALSLEAVMPIIKWWSASESSNWVKVVKDWDNYYICNSWNLSNCNKKNASTWVKYEKWLNRWDKYYVCNASSSSCNSMSHSSIIYQHHETMEFDWYYICSSSSCFFTDSNTKINKDNWWSSYDNSYYVCQWEKYKCWKNNASYKYSITTDKIYKCNANVSSCNSSNATTTITKKSVSSSSSYSSSNIDFSWLVADIDNELKGINEATTYYNKGLNAAMADDYKTAISNQIEVVKIYRSLYKSNSKDYKALLANSYSNLWLYYCFDRDYTNADKAYQFSLDLINDPDVRADYEECKKENNTQSYKPKCTDVYWPNSFLADDGLCYCKNWYNWNKEETLCVTHDERCRSFYWDHVEWIWNDPVSCVCQDWYERNDSWTKCIKVSNVTNNTVSNNTNNWSYNLDNNNYSDEYNRAYEYAYANKITTMPTIEQANMNSPIIRAEIAKMLSNWVKSLWYTPDTSKSCKFNDISSVKWDLYTAIIESCQLGIMGQWINNYRPYDTITRWEVSTAVSRILWWGQYEWWDPFYRNHMNALRNIWVLDNLNNPNTNELRWNVMVMLMRASDSGIIVNCEDPVTILACEVEPSQCPKECLEEDEEIDVDALVEEISNDQAEAFSGYMVSVAGLIKDVKSQTIFKKDFNDLTHDEIIAEIKSRIKTVESDKDKLLEIWSWKWDSSLIDEVIDFAGLQILRLKQMIESEWLLVEIGDKLQNSGKTSDLEKLKEDGKIIWEKLDKCKKNVENKYEDLRNLFNVFYKKYQPK